MDENLFAQLADDIESLGGLAEEDRDFLERLQKMAEEIEKEAA